MHERKLAVAALLLAMSTARADDAAVSYQLEGSVASTYVFRGIPQYTTRRDPSRQNTALVKVDHVGPGAITFAAWNAVALSGYDMQPGTAVEVDLSASYGITLGKVAVAAGYMAYIFPNHSTGAPMDGAHEVQVLASYDNPYVVPTVGAFVEVVRQQGAYVTLAGAHDFHHGAWTVSPAVCIGAATYRKYLGGDQAIGPHLNDITAGVAARVDLPGGMYLVGRFSYALRGTPVAEMPATTVGWGFDGRSSAVGSIGFGVAR